MDLEQGVEGSEAVGAFVGWHVFQGPFPDTFLRLEPPEPVLVAQSGDTLVEGTI